MHYILLLCIFLLFLFFNIMNELSINAQYSYIFQNDQFMRWSAGIKAFTCFFPDWH